MFERIRQWWAKRRYIRKLGPLLVLRYGRSLHFKPGQISKTIEIYGLPQKDMRIALAYFATKLDFYGVLGTAAKANEYESIRQEIADKHFEGRMDFSAMDVITSVSGDASIGGAPGLGAEMDAGGPEQ